MNYRLSGNSAEQKLYHHCYITLYPPSIHISLFRGTQNSWAGQAWRSCDSVGLSWHLNHHNYNSSIELAIGGEYITPSNFCPLPSHIAPVPSSCCMFRLLSRASNVWKSISTLCGRWTSYCHYPGDPCLSNCSFLSVSYISVPYTALPDWASAHLPCIHREMEILWLLKLQQGISLHCPPFARQYRLKGKRRRNFRHSLKPPNSPQMQTSAPQRPLVRLNIP